MKPAEAHILAGAAVQILKNWGADEATRHMMLGTVTDFQEARRRGELEAIPEAITDRMALILAIHVALRTIYRNPDRGYAWMNRPNTVFENRPPIELIRTGNPAELSRIATYLSASIQIW